VIKSRISTALVVLAASAGLAGCTNFGPYGGVGIGVGSSYGYGYGSPYGYGGYGSPYGSYYGGYPYFGWYDGFYYPGAGYWVYDPYGHQYPINERQSHYWQNIRERFQKARGLSATAEAKPNFSGFTARAQAGATIPGVDLNAVRAQAQAQAQADQASLSQIREARRQAQVERQSVQAEQRQQARTERQESMREQVIERREARRAARTGKSDD
jgi:hypothetical protein